ncbi:Antitermination protein [Serratia grimesii]|uniref:antitermination protein n=1 Tax=Serratia grimesii TaxID=82995 RepID=UPI002177569A|nr:antitermination protein [Serratia grimesii]CAI1837852.1 Antitermination protein [Serratia grimesii]
MNFEQALKYFFAKTSTISDSPRATASDALTGTDIMAAFGLADSKAGFGFDLFMAKHGISGPERAVESLYQFSLTQVGKSQSIANLAEDTKHIVLQTLATFAFQDYSRSAASVRPCECCNGKGLIDTEVFTTKVHTPFPAREIVKMSLQMEVKGFKPSEYDVHRELREKVKVLCPTCKGKKVLSNACRCHGKGKVLDKDATVKHGGIPVYKDCDKCDARGYSRLKFSAVMAALNQQESGIGKTFAYDHLQPFMEMLVTQCHKEESLAEAMLNMVTKGDGIAA